MAPKRSQASSPRRLPAKKQKVSKDQGMLEAVTEAISGFDGINADCRAMLVAMAPLSLGIMSDERDEHQQLAVRMQQEVLEKIRQRLQEAIAAEGAKVTDVEKAKADLEAVVAQQEAVLKEKETVMESKKMVLVEKTQVTVTTKKVLKEKQDIQKEGDAQMLLLKSDRDGLEKTIAEDFKLLQAGELAPAQAKKHYNGLLPFAKKCNLDESLMTALPTATAKKKEARGQFDDMVLGELDKSFTKKLTELEAGIAAEAPPAAARAAAVEAAETDWNTAKAAQHAAAQDLSAAQAAQKEQAGKVKDAKKAVANYEPEYTKATAARDKCVAALEEYKNWPIACFDMLRNKVKPAPVPEEPEAPAEEPAEEAAEAAAEAAAEP